MQVLSPGNQLLDGDDRGRFGYRVSISGDRALVGFMDRKTDQDSAYVYEFAAAAVSPPVVNEEGQEAGTRPEVSGDEERSDAEPGESGTPANFLSPVRNLPGRSRSQESRSRGRSRPAPRTPLSGEWRL